MILFTWMIFAVTCILFSYNSCNIGPEIKDEDNIELLQSFRRKSEEDLEYTNTKHDDLKNNLESFLVDNAKEIFGSINEIPETVHYENDSVGSPIHTTSEIVSSIPVSRVMSILHTNDVMLYENLSLGSTTDILFVENSKSTEVMDTLINEIELKPLTNTLLAVGDVQRGNDEISIISRRSPRINTSDITQNDEEIRLSCIFCNNVALDDCNYPKNKLIPSIVCKRPYDLCYSMHTPFGIIDRGCFNIDHNLTTYVCSCNLCNYVSFSEMPVIFSNKEEWIQNILELSRTRHFRKTIFKDMACLSCEVNTTKHREVFDHASCLDGEIYVFKHLLHS